MTPCNSTLLFLYAGRYSATDYAGHLSSILPGCVIRSVFSIFWLHSTSLFVHYFKGFGYWRGKSYLPGGVDVNTGRLVVWSSLRTEQANYCTCVAGMCATAFHPLCAREAKYYMEVCSMEDSEDVSSPNQIATAIGSLSWFTV